MAILMLAPAHAGRASADTGTAPGQPASPVLSGADGIAANASADDQGTATATRPPVTTGWRDGFVLQSEDGEFRLQLGLLVHADGRFAADDEAAAVTDTFALRRVRPYLRGRLARRFEFFLNPDFAGGNLVVQDAYLDTVFAPAFRIRAGKGKTPFGLERLHSASNLLFFERALPTALVPNRDIGVQALGDLAGGRVSYAAGVMNGVPDGGSADLDTNDGADLSGRVVGRPFATAGSSPLRGLGLALSGSVGKQSGALALPTFRTSSLQQPFFSYLGTGAIADGTRTRYSPQVWFFYKAFGGWAEYVRTETPVRTPTTAARDIGHTAWQVAASWVVTGEAATDAGAGVRPRRNFEFGNGGWGALQLAARYHVLSVDPQAVALGLAAPGASRKAEAVTIGATWFLNPHVKYVFNVERTVFGDDPEGRRRAEHALVFRTQLSL